MKRSVTLKLDEEDCKFLEKTYGDLWVKRMEQHIHSEVNMRKHDVEVLRKDKKWDY